MIDVFPIRMGAAIVADKHRQAKAAARDVQVAWSEGDVPKLNTAAMQTAMRNYSGEGTGVIDDGNASKALSRAQTRVNAVYEVPYVAHATMEPQNATVWVKGDSAEVWAPTRSGRRPALTGQLITDLLTMQHSRAVIRCERVDLSALARRVAAELEQGQPGQRVQWAICATACSGRPDADAKVRRANGVDRLNN